MLSERWTHTSVQEKRKRRKQQERKGDLWATVSDIWAHSCSVSESNDAQARHLSRRVWKMGASHIMVVRGTETERRKGKGSLEITPRGLASTDLLPPYRFYFLPISQLTHQSISGPIQLRPERSQSHHLPTFPLNTAAPGVKPPAHTLGGTFNV